MRIQFLSDLHTEFHANMEFIKSHSFEVTGDVLVLAGDIGYLNDPALGKLQFWKWASENYREVMIIAGNHEFYNGCDLLSFGDSWTKMFLSNVGYYHNKVVRIDDTDFVLSTLWSHISPADRFFIERGMNDFRQIRYGGRLLSAEDYNVEHEKCLSFIQQSVAESTAKHIVVVTHHLPTRKAVSPHYRTNILNSAFATELGEYIVDNKIDYWIYGHSHENMDIQLGTTQVVCNQLGYVKNGEGDSGFDSGRFVVLS